MNFVHPRYHLSSVYFKSRCLMMNQPEEGGEGSGLTLKFLCFSALQNLYQSLCNHLLLMKLPVRCPSLWGFTVYCSFCLMIWSFKQCFIVINIPLIICRFFLDFQTLASASPKILCVSWDQIWACSLHVYSFNFQ